MATRTFVRCALGAALAPVALLLAACEPAADVTLEPASTVHAAGGVGAAPIVAVNANGEQATAWVSAPDSGSDGRLYVSVADGAPVELRDTLGPVEPHGEAPPKLAYAADGSLHALYVVGKLVPGRRFPASALRHVRSTDGGRTWTAPVTVTDGGEDFGSHNFHALHVAPDGTIYVAWLDGRLGRSATFLTHSTDGGRTWAPNVRVGSGESCPCCRTAIAAAGDGTVYVAWREVAQGNVRDVVVARSTDRGTTWSEPRRVHDDGWVFEGCPHAGPALQVDADGRLHAAWWTGKAGAAGVYYASSNDGARTFGTPVALGTAEFSKPAHVQLALAGERDVVAAWDDGTLRQPQVVLRRSRDGGRTFGPTVPVSDPGRAATFPVLAVSGARLTVLWSEQSVEAASHAEHQRPDMRDPNAVMGLPVVGASQVLRRTGTLP